MANLTKMSASFLAKGKCAGCDSKMGLGHKMGISKIILGSVEDFLNDEKVIIYCPVCEDWMEVVDMELEEYEKGEVENLLRRGELEWE